LSRRSAGCNEIAKLFNYVVLENGVKLFTSEVVGVYRLYQTRTICQSGKNMLNRDVDNMWEAPEVAVNV
jgi:hypothetical protein